MRRIKQIEEYKKMISDAFLELLQNNTMDEITISQIANKARIGRNTFYNHFQKKEDVLEYLMHGLLEEIQEKLQQEDTPSIRTLLIWRFALLKQNPLLTIFHRQDDIKQFFFQFRDSITPMFNFPAQKDIYKMEFFQGGIDYVTSRWIISGMKESPEEMVNKVLSLMNK